MQRVQIFPGGRGDRNSCLHLKLPLAFNICFIICLIYTSTLTIKTLSDRHRTKLKWQFYNTPYMSWEMSPALDGVNGLRIKCCWRSLQAPYCYFTCCTKWARLLKTKGAAIGPCNACHAKWPLSHYHPLTHHPQGRGLKIHYTKQMTRPHRDLCWM